MSHWADRSPVLNMLAILVTVLLAGLLGLGVLTLLTRPASFRHFNDELAAGRYQIAPITEAERSYWRPRLDPLHGSQIEGYRIAVTPLWYDPQPIDVVCLRIGASEFGAFLVVPVKNRPPAVRGLPQRDYRVRQVEAFCNTLQPALAPLP